MSRHKAEKERTTLPMATERAPIPSPATYRKA